MDRLLSPRQRDRSRVVLHALTGGLAFVTVAGTAGATGIAAHDSRVADAAKAAAKAQAENEAARAHHEALLTWAQENPVVVTVDRPHRTVVGPATIVRASAPGTARVGGSGGGSVGSGTTSGGGGGGGTSVAAPPPPPPPPPVASSGS